MADNKLNNAINRLLKTNPTNYAMNQFGSSLKGSIANNNAYFTQFTNLILTMCEFDLPETCDAEYLMKSLFFNGQAAFCEDPALGWINLNCMIVGKPNIYNKPNTIEAYSDQGFRRQYTKDKFIYVEANPLRIPLVTYVSYFCNIITDIENTARVNLKAQKTPITFTGSKEQQLSLINAYQKLEGNVPYIFANQDFKDGIKIEALNTGAPFLADKLQELKKSYKAEFLSFIGLNNVEDKKERMVVDEVNANNQLISSAAQILMSRLEPAIEELSKRSGYPCSVKLRTQSEILERDNQNQNTEAEENGSIYDNA